MGMVTLGGRAAPSATNPVAGASAPRQGLSVWVRRGWNAESYELDNWTRIPYLEPRWAVTAAFPGRSAAELVYQVGRIRREDSRAAPGPNAMRVFQPEDYQDLYVAIVLHPDIAARRSGAKAHTIWLGVIQAEQLELQGGLAGIPRSNSGRQVIQCAGLESVLERRFVRRGQVVLPDGTRRSLDWHPTFNERFRTGYHTRPNRSPRRIRHVLWSDLSTTYVSWGFHAFLYDETPPVEWSVMDILEYVLYWSNDPLAVPEGELRDAAFHVDGYSVEAPGVPDLATPLHQYLRTVTPTLDPDRRNVWSILTELIDPKRGFSARFTWSEYDELDPAPGGQRVGLPDTRYPIGVELFSLFDEDVGVGNALLPANPTVETITLDEGHGREATVVLDGADRYDRVVVRGERVLTCFSAGFGGADVGYGLASLVPAWTPAAEAAYRGETSDAARSRPVHDRVYSAFRFGGGPSREFNWRTFAGHVLNPRFDASGNVVLDEPNDETWMGGKELEPRLPILMDADVSYESVLPEYERPLVFVELEGVLKPSGGGTGPYYARGDIPSQLDMGQVHLRVSDRDMEIRLEANPAYRLAKGTFNAGGMPAGADGDKLKFDYRKMVVTLALRGDSRPTVVESLPSLSTRPTYRHRELIIDVPDAEVWIVAPNTVVGTNPNGSLKFWTGNRIVRDDSDRLRRIAALAKAWYQTPRAAMVFSASGIGVTPAVGTVVHGVVSGQVFRQVRSCVTELRHDFVKRLTTASTGVVNLDWV